MATQPLESVQREAKDLRNQVKSLTAELEEIREAQEKLARRRVRVAGFATGLASRILVGPGLVRSARAWFAAPKTAKEPIPVNESGDFIAAVVRRIVRVGWIGLIVAALPSAVMIWQSVLIQSQNQKIGEQIAQQGEQFQEQSADTLIVRRAQLLDTLYAQNCRKVPAAIPRVGLARDAPAGEPNTPPSQGETLSEECVPRAHARARQEAALAFLKIEHGRGILGPDLDHALLSETKLLEADLSRAILNEADLSGTDLSRASLAGAKLRRTNLSGANLAEADLSRTILDGAMLDGADLRGADLTRGRKLTQVQVDGAQGNAETKLPLGLKMPEAWKTPSSEEISFFGAP